MTNKEYTEIVATGIYPGEMLVPLDPPFVDDRGIIQNLLLTSITSVTIITSKAGSVRSNHYHKTDWHYLYVLSGSMKYYERAIDESNNVEPIIVKAGQMVFTPPKQIHKTEFIEDTVLLSFAHNIRDHEHHEADIVREDF